MQKPILDKSVLAKWLGDVISTEMEKPVNKINWDLVDECEKYLAELYSDIVIPDEQIKQNIANIKKKYGNIKLPFSHRRTPRMRRIIAAICIIMSVLACGVSAYAFIPGFREMIHDVLNIPIGESLDMDGMTFTRHGEKKKYRNIEELIQAENLDILIPNKLPDEMSIVSITVVNTDGKDEYYISLSDRTASVLASVGEIDVSMLSDKAVIYENNYGIVSYITDDGNLYSSVTVHNGWTYYISVFDKSQLITILDNLY